MRPVKKSDGHDGYIDLLWRGIILVEHKSRGLNLDRAFQQAKDYFPGLKDIDLPRYILVSDFSRFRLYDLEENTRQEFTLKEFYKNVRLFGFIAGYQTTSYKEQDPANVKAAERMGKLHDKLKAIGYEGHDLEVYLVRLLFCLFAEDTSIFERRQFQDLIEQRTAEDGSDLAMRLEQLFQVLDVPEDKRLKNLDEQLAAFRYVNGSLFSERLPMASFDTEMRENLLLCCALDWSRISPAIFGALFQSVMDQKLRRNLGAHYTTEKNILKLIRPLFLDELRAEFERLKNQPKKLYDFHQRLAQLKFLDPACGCGNFLVIAYRELRLLELNIIRSLYGKAQTASLDVAELNILCDVDQFYGIEIEEFPAQIAQTAMWLMDHQMNLLVSEEFGSYFVRLPLRKSATIVRGNALTLDWRDVVKPEELSYILGNPPFVGKNFRDEGQNADMDALFKGVNNYKSLDFVTCWFVKAAQFMSNHVGDGIPIRAAFVSTNSITMGEQVAPLWQPLLDSGLQILFAHRTFAWESEAKGRAAVHVVIIGFEVQGAEGNTQNNIKRLFDYPEIRSEPIEIRVSQISPYLIDAPSVIIDSRTKPLCAVPPMKKGNQPTDGGNLLLSPEEKVELLSKEPQAERWLRPLLGAEEFINGKERWCLWLIGIKPYEIRAMPEVMKRVAAVKEMRLLSSDAGTRELASRPTQFRESHEYKSYVLVPSVSSERRTYIPMGLFDGHTISTNLNLIIPNATIYHFGILQSTMHMGWMRAVCGRLKSDYRYSAGIVYNNFPWPQLPTDRQRQTIENAAQAVLDTRAKYPGSSLADLYDPLTMPPELVKAHHKLDAAVDAAYSKKKFSGDSDRVAFLFELYRQLTVGAGLVPAQTKP